MERHNHGGTPKLTGKNDLTPHKRSVLSTKPSLLLQLSSRESREDMQAGMQEWKEFP